MNRIKVLVVDDSVVVRRLVTDVLGADPRIEVVGVAANGKIALSKIPQLNPDILTLDIEMPEMDGLQTLRHLSRDHPRLPVIMFSTLSEHGARATLDALALGARDYVTKPANVGSVQASMASIKDQLVPKIVALAASSSRHSGVPAHITALPGTPPRTTAAPQRRTSRPEVLLIGVSTGGPEALAQVLPQLPANLPVPVLVVQHMPPVFTRLLAERLDGRSHLTVSEAADGDAVVPGRVLLAPGNFHLRLRRVGTQMRVVLDQGTPENFCRPAVDVLFRSAVDMYGGGCLAVVLTGMGSDGARGAAAVVAAGGEVLAQDQRTSVVWGMPGAVVAAGLASEELALTQVAGAVLRRLSRALAPLTGVGR